jgi:hypothetical protein
VAGTASGALTGNITVTITGAVAISKIKIKASPDLFFFWQGNVNLKSQLNSATEALERSLCCMQNFAVVFFLGADAAFSKLVAERTLSKFIV